MKRKIFKKLDQFGIPNQITLDRGLERMLARLNTIENRLACLPQRKPKVLQMRIIPDHYEPGGMDLKTRAKQIELAWLAMKKSAVQGRELDSAGLCSLHRLLTRMTLGRDRSGIFRTTPVSLRHPSGKVLHRYPPASQIKPLLEQAFEWSHFNRSQPWIRAFGFHLLLPSIHPFSEANGRLARLSEEWYLRQDGLKNPDFLPSETALFLAWEPCDRAMQKSRKEMDLSPVVSWMTGNRIRVLENFLP